MPRPRPQNLLELCDRFPPSLCRLAAKKGKRPLSVREIAQASGLSKDTISRWSRKNSWAFIIEPVMKFCLACGVNHLKRKRKYAEIRRRGMKHLFRKQNNPAQKAMIARILMNR